MRRKEKEITRTKDIEKMIQDSSVCRLAMVDGSTPYLVPMNFGYGKGCLYFHSAKKGKKINLMKKNPNVCFEVDRLIRLKKAESACDWGLEYKSVVGSGTIEFLENHDEKRKALDIIMSHYSKRIFEYSDEMLEETLVIKLCIDHMTGKQS